MTNEARPFPPASRGAPEGQPPTSAGDAGAPPRISSDRLFGRSTEIQIEHHGVIYRLRQTALGKLILTK